MILAAAIPQTEPRFVGCIPVRNLWLLMLYASELFRELAPKNISIEDDEEISLIWSLKCCPTLLKSGFIEISVMGITCVKINLEEFGDASIY